MDGRVPAEVARHPGGGFALKIASAMSDRQEFSTQMNRTNLSAISRIGCGKENSRQTDPSTESYGTIRAQAISSLQSMNRYKAALRTDKVSHGSASILECPCPPIGMIDLVGKKWAVCVVSLLGKYGTVRFGPMQRCLSGVSPATLTTTLRSLERVRLVRRVPVQGRSGPVKAYSLTDSGRTLYVSLLPLATWLQ